MSIQDKLGAFAVEHKEFTLQEVENGLKIPSTIALAELERLVDRRVIQQVGRMKWVAIETKYTPSINDTLFLDWCDLVPKLTYCYKNDLLPMIIGPKGVGKTSGIRRACEILGKKMFTVNFSLRSREHNFLGHLNTRPDGTIYFEKGPLINAMIEGATLYLDELNLCDPAVLIRLDEALDFRREINIEDQTFKASPGFWPIASINPIDRYHAGTHELPGQLLSRFPVRIFMDYPEPSVEFRIVSLHVPKIEKNRAEFMDVLQTIAQLRKSDLPYIPSIRESIAIARLTNPIDEGVGMNMSAALKLTLVDVYRQWGSEYGTDVAEIIYSRMKLKIEPLEYHG